MLMTKLTVTTAVLIAVTVVAASGSLAAYRVAEVEQAVTRPKEQPRADVHGDPLPDGAVARIGTSRFLQKALFYSQELAYTPDGKHLLSNDGSKSVVLWEAANGKAVRRIEIGEKGFYRFALSPDGKTLATVGTANPIVKLWNLADGKQFRQIPIVLEITPMFAEGPPFIAFSPDGKTIAVIRGNGTTQLLDMATWEAKAPVTHGKGRRAVLLPNGELLVIGSNGFRWCDAATGREIRQLENQFTSLWPLEVSQDGKHLAVIDRSGVLHLHDAATGKQISSAQLDVFKGKGVDTAVLCFSPQGETLACYYTSSSGTSNPSKSDFIFFAADSLKELRRWGKQDRALGRMAYSPDGKTLALNLGTVIDIRDAATGMPAAPGIQRLSDFVTWVGFGDDGKSLIAGCRDGRVTLWDSMAGKLQQTSQNPPHDARLQSLWLFRANFTKDGKTAAMEVAIREFHVWEPMSGKSLCDIKGAHCDGDEAVFSPDGKLLSLLDEKSQIGLWNTSTGKHLFSLPTKYSYVRGFSNDGRQIATAASSIAENGMLDDKLIRIWDTATGKDVTRLTIADGAMVRQFAFLPDGKTLISYHEKHSEEEGFEPQIASLRFWNLATGHETKRINIPPRYRMGGNHSIVFSHDLKTVGLATLDGAVLYELVSSQERGRFGGHCDGVYALAFSPDGRLLATGSGDFTALVWDVSGISPDGKLVSRDVTPEELMRIWSDLAGSDGVKAYRAMWTMVAGGRQSVPFLAERLLPVAQVDNQRVTRLIADLDNEQFKTRTEASNELKQLGELAEPALRKALDGKVTLETRQRLTLLLDELRNRPFLPQQLQILRALESLENLGTAEARQLLTLLATGAPGAMQTKEAKASLERLNKSKATGN